MITNKWNVEGMEREREREREREKGVHQSTSHYPNTVHGLL